MNYNLSQLRPIDAGFGGYIQGAYQHIDTCCTTDGFESFLARDKKKRAYRGRYENPVEFLAALRSTKEQSMSTEVTPETIRTLNKAELPLIYYYRHLNYQLTNPGSAPKGTVDITRRSEDGTQEVKEKWNSINLDLGYRIVFMAYDSPTLDLLVGAFLMYVNAPVLLDDDGELRSDCFCGQIANPGFEVNYMFGPVSVSVNDKSSIAATHLPIDAEQGRIYAAEISNFGITAPIIRGSLGFEYTGIPDVQVIRNGPLGMTHG